MTDAPPKTLNPDSPLFPLLPSVQKLFVHFCQPQRAACKRESVEMTDAPPKTLTLIPLCFFCCLLFKNSSFASVSRNVTPASGSLSNDRCASQNPNPDSPLFPLLPSVQKLSVRFCQPQRDAWMRESAE
jgi:hypothetical protein